MFVGGDILHYIKSVNRSIQRCGAIISGLAILTMMLIIVSDVVLRNIFHHPIQGSHTIIENFIMPIAIFPALGYVYMENVLPRLGEFIAKRPQWFQTINKYLLIILDLIVFSLLTYFTFMFFLNGFNAERSVPVASNLIPVWPVYLVVALGYALVLIEVILRFLNEIHFSIKKL